MDAVGLIRTSLHIGHDHLSTTIVVVVVSSSISSLGGMGGGGIGSLFVIGGNVVAV